jgi:thiosulfate reductase cytochrome b subunit
MTTQARTLRQGLPRWPGGGPWPPADDAPVLVAAPSRAVALQRPRVRADTAVPASTLTPETVTGPGEMEPAEVAAIVGERVATAASFGGLRPIRRGLPRVPGGEPSPPEGFAPGRRAAEVERVESTVPDEIAPAPDATETEARPARAPLAPPTARAHSRSTPVPAPEPRRFGAYASGKSLGFAVIGGFALLFAAMVMVVAAAWFQNLPFMQDFLTAYPGEYHLPEGATPGFPAWVQWQHFFNVFLMVLIIRSGLQVRTEKRPGAFWTSKWSKDGKGKISLALWFHQSLDVLWLANGMIFVVLLFVTGHWMRIVPTSWAVFPNALSALLQYVSLNWPTENGWVNYNSLQQLMYFVTVFVAAPLAAVTGVRMSGLWPNAKTLNRIYPVEWARAVHFPVMLYFVAFIIVHVALVFATSALRNLNHMYGGSDVVNWAGFWIFSASLLIIVGGWIAARPLVLAPIAKLTGKVTAR